MEDWFQAKTTAQSILEFVEDPETRAEAELRLINIERLENTALMLMAPIDSTVVKEPTPEAP